MNGKQEQSIDSYHLYKKRKILEIFITVWKEKFVNHFAGKFISIFLSDKAYHEFKLMGEIRANNDEGKELKSPKIS